MNILVVCIVVIVVLALAVWGVSVAPVIPTNFKMILYLLFAAVAIIFICKKAGWF